MKLNMPRQQVQLMDAVELKEPMETLSTDQFTLAYRLNMLMDRIRFYKDRARNLKQPDWMVSKRELKNDMKYVKHGYQLIMGNHITEMDIDNKKRMNVLWKKYRI